MGMAKHETKVLERPIGRTQGQPALIMMAAVLPAALSRGGCCLCALAMKNGLNLNPLLKADSKSAECSTECLLLMHPRGHTRPHTVLGRRTAGSRGHRRRRLRGLGSHRRRIVGAKLGRSSGLILSSWHRLLTGQAGLSVGSIAATEQTHTERISSSASERWSETVSQ